jgi:hypothetical protein
MDIKGFEKLVRTENTARRYFKNWCGKTTMFSAPDVTVKNSISWPAKDTGAKAAIIPFMTSRIAG